MAYMSVSQGVVVNLLHLDGRYPPWLEVSSSVSSQEKVRITNHNKVHSGVLRVQCVGFSGVQWWGWGLQPTEDPSPHSLLCLTFYMNGSQSVWHAFRTGCKINCLFLSGLVWLLNCALAVVPHGIVPHQNTHQTHLCGQQVYWILQATNTVSTL